MPTIVTHAAPALVLACGLGSGRVPGRLLVFAVFCAILPDLDVIGFKLGIAYGNVLGHRGASHSLVFAFGLGLMAACLAPFFRCRAITAFSLIGFAVLSHIALDAMTNGGLGVAAFWPWSETRYFLPWRPIRVSPFSPSAFLSARGATVLVSEFFWVWLPGAAVALALWLARKTGSWR